MRNTKMRRCAVKGKFGRVLAALIVTSGLAGTPVALAVTSAAPAAAAVAAQQSAQVNSLGSTVASIAEGQEGVEDNPATTYCNKYSAHWGDGTKCSNGTRAIEWCADFAAWTWQQAGVSFTYGSASSDINANASSFYHWAVAHGTWHAAGSGYTPQPGDVAVYGSSGAAAAHVGVVVSNGSAGPNVVNGDWEIKYLSQFPTAVYYKANENSEAGVPLAGYAALPATAPSSSPSVAVLPTSDGHIQVFSDANGTLGENWYDPATGHIGGGSSVAGMTVQGTPALVARPGQDVIDAFIRNSAGQIVETWYNWGTGSWGGWITVNGGTFTSDPSAVATSDGHDQVFATSGSGTLAMNWFDPGTGHIGGGSSVAGMTVQGTPALVARPGQDVIDAFIRNSAGQIVETWYNWGTGSWGGWITISGATFTGGPQAVATSDGHDQIFANNNGTIAQNWFDLGTGHIGNWVTI